MSSVSSSLMDKVVLITGASSGVGAGTAVELSRHGCRLALTGRNMHNLQQTAEQCQKEGLPRQKIVLISADITSESDVNRMVDTVIQTFGRLDVLVNSAGVLYDNTITNKCDMAKYDEVMGVNLKGPLLVCRAAVPHLIKTKGNIVNVSSVSGIRPTTGVLFYCLSKAALNQLTQSLASELAPKGVRVNSVNLALIRTGMHLRSGFTPEKYAQLLEESKSIHPIGRYGEVEDVSQAIAFLASDAASFITGALLPIDGGRLLVFPRGPVNIPGAPAKL